MYKVMACHNGIGNDVLLMAIAAAFKDGVDIISMSIGGVGGWADSPALAPFNAIGKRIPFVVSFGNAGQVSKASLLISCRWRGRSVLICIAHKS